MKKIKLNDFSKPLPNGSEYYLDSHEEYVINLADETKYQAAIMKAVSMFPLPALLNYHNWLYLNDFDPDHPNPTNEVVAKYYGKGPLWKTEYSIGVVVKAEGEDDCYIVMECSRKNKGFKHTQVVLTLGGCY